MKLGTGAIEIKSGYGLELSAEIKMLEVIDKFKTLGSIIKRNFKNLKVKLDKFHSEQIELITQQQEIIRKVFK